MPPALPVKKQEDFKCVSTTQAECLVCPKLKGQYRRFYFAQLERHERRGEHQSASRQSVAIKAAPPVQMPASFGEASSVRTSPAYPQAQSRAARNWKPTVEEVPDIEALGSQLEHRVESPPLVLTDLDVCDGPQRSLSKSSFSRNSSPLDNQSMASNSEEFSELPIKINPDLPQAEGFADLNDVIAEQQKTFFSTRNIGIPLDEDSAFDEEHNLVDMFCGTQAADTDSDFDSDVESAGRETIPVGSHNVQRSRGKAHVRPSQPSYPWGSNALFLTQLLFSSPRLRFSEAQQEAILQWAQKMGTPEVPTITALRKSQERVESLVGRPTVKVVSPSGTTSHLNTIGSAIAKDFANPITRLAMTDYAVDRGNALCELQGGLKMLSELPDNLTQPCVRVHGTRFFINELLRTRSGSFFIPKRYVYASPTPKPVKSDPREWELYALGHNVVRQLDGFFRVERELCHVRTAEFLHDFPSLLEDRVMAGCSFEESSAEYKACMPNPLREKAGPQRMVYLVPLVVFIDDVSANISKQWNKNHVVYMSNALLAREMIEKEFCVRFVTSSPHATPLELMAAFQNSVKEAADNGIVAWDCKDNEEVLLIPYTMFDAADNPMLAELCSQAGLASNYFCRTCDVGGTQAFKRSEEGYSSLFRGGIERTPEDTKAKIHEQLRLATNCRSATAVAKSIRDSGIHDAASSSLLNFLHETGRQLLASSGLVPDNDPSELGGEETITPSLNSNFTIGGDQGSGKSKMTKEEIHRVLESELEKRIHDHPINPLLDVEGFNVHKDTPTEILHTVLLGVVKYFWGQTMYHLKLKSNVLKLRTFCRRLDSLSENGLNFWAHLSSEYLCQYSGSLIGKHFKCLAQVMPFLVYGLVDDMVLHAWNVLGALVVLLWHTSIEDKEVYLAELSRTIDDFLNVTAKCAPSIIITKPKFHFLIHLPDYIRRFGPAILFSTERYERFNRVFRLSCIYSNRQAPSRDSCQTFSTLDIVKHIATGGYWYDLNEGAWVRAGSFVRTSLGDNPSQARLLGVPLDEHPLPGSARLLSPSALKQKGLLENEAILWRSTISATVIQSLPPQTSSSSTQLEVPQNFDKRALFYQAASLIAFNGDSVRIGDSVIYSANIGDASSEYKLAKIIEILNK